MQTYTSHLVEVYMYVCPLENNCTCMLSLVSYVDWRKKYRTSSHVKVIHQAHFFRGFKRYTTSYLGSR